MTQVAVTDHALQRYRERVDPAATIADARTTLTRMIEEGRRRTTARHWMREVGSVPGLTFVYWAGLPGVCGLVFHGALVTVVTRQLCRARLIRSRLTNGIRIRKRVVRGRRCRIERFGASE